HNRLYVEGLTGDAVVFNAVGKLCMTIPVSVQNEIDVSSLPVGLYFIRANRPRSKSVVYRFVKL
ncbi:MAG TPA: T9SS type A sorting domain-containing protein, partial [Chitinophagales bacterium]|nr:T9SS type A sorting domain-containing protein [Chitinophagales bacterium]